MVNDISGGQADPDMLPLVGKLKVPYVLMHMRGTPQTMEAESNYDNVTRELISFFGACVFVGLSCFGSVIIML